MVELTLAQRPGALFVQLVNGTGHLEPATLRLFRLQSKTEAKA
jgi:hypothetical protein